MRPRGEDVPETVPVSTEETRGGEQAGDWKVSEQAQWAAEHIKHTYGGDVGDGEKE